MEERKIVVNVGIPTSVLNWIDKDKGRQPRSDYLRDIICAEVRKKQETSNEANYVEVAN